MSELKLKRCPFCGSKIEEISKIPLWSGHHGYHDRYEFKIICKKCGANVKYEKNDSVYRTEEEAINNVIKAWNRRSNPFNLL